MDNNLNFINENIETWIDKFLEYNGVNRDFLLNNYEKDFELEKLKDVYKGAELVIDTMNNNKRILLVTDYDCDGLSSAITLTKFFRDNLKYKNCDTLVNKRKQGNGFNKNLMAQILEENEKDKVSLIITADHGSSDDPAFGILKLQGIDTVVTDHHEVLKPLHNPNVFINVMREDSDYFKGISGCHVAFLLCVAIWKKLNRPLDDLDNLLPYVAISTVVDQMPMNNKHNRDCVKTGLNYINKKADKNFEIYKNKTKLGHIIRSKDIGFKIGPFFNSGNRTDIENEIFEAFALTDENMVIDRFNFGLLNNQRRKNEQKKILTDVKEELYKEYDSLKDVYGIALTINSTFGIAGPIASTLGSELNRPTIIFKESYDPTILSGSGRSIIEIDTLQILKKLEKDRPDIVLKAGGHAKAFGIEIKADKLKEFRELFSTYIKNTIGSIPKPKYDIMAKVDPKDIGLSLFYQVEELGPYGNNYLEPIFYSELEYVRHFNLGSGVSIDFRRSDKSYINGIFFFSGSELNKDLFSEKIKPGMICKVIYNINLNTYSSADTIMYKTNIDIKDIILD